MNELKQLEKHIAQLERDLEVVWWKCAF